MACPGLLNETADDGHSNGEIEAACASLVGQGSLLEIDEGRWYAVVGVQQ